MGPFDLMGLVAGVLERLGIPYFVTGSVAMIMYGEERLTNDVDVVARLGYGHIDALVAAFPAPEFYISREGVLDAMRHGQMFNIIHVSSGLKVDVIVTAGTGFDRLRLERARRMEALPGISAVFSSPEDLIVNKLLFYKEGGSDKHLRDIASMLKVSGGELDRAYIESWADRMGVGQLWRELTRRVP